VRLKRSEVRCGTAESQQDGAVIFPLRVGTHTRMITPEQIPMFVDPHARRVAILLSQAVGKDVFVFATRYRSEKNTWVETATILAVDLIANSVTMAVGKEPSKTQIVVPLDMIEAACQAQDQWHVFLRGVFKQVHWADDANPGLKGLRLILDPCG
jgi:hypothetical protein